MARKITRRKLREIDRTRTGGEDDVPIGATTSGRFTVTDPTGNTLGPFPRGGLLQATGELRIGLHWACSDGEQTLPLRDMLLRPERSSLVPPPTPSFTQEDQFNPTYCPGCRQQVPNAVAAQHGGYCASCAQWIAAAAHAREEVQEAERRVREAEEAAQRARQEEVNSMDTGMGRCPQCGSPNTSRIRKTETDGAAQTAFCCCMAGCIAWPLALLAPFLFRGRATWGKCNSCGHEWPL